MPTPKRKRPPRAAAGPEIAAPRQTLAFIPGVPILWQLAALGIVALLLIGGVGGAVAYVHHRWYAEGHDAGVAETTARYEKLLAGQAAANHAAIEASTQQAIVAADAQAKAEAAYDAALAQLDANSGGADATVCGLDKRRVDDLNTIK